MWDDALSKVESKERAGIDIKRCRKWLSILTTKLFETQSILSRHRFKLTKRLKDTMFERPQKLPAILKKRIMDQHEISVAMEPTRKRTKYETIQEGDRKLQRNCSVKRKNASIDKANDRKSKKRILNQTGIKRKHSIED